MELINHQPVIRANTSKKFTEIIDAYTNDIGLEALASRYAYNIVNGRFLWRNRVGAQEVIIHVKHGSFNESLKFDAYDYPLKNTTSSDEKIVQLTALIKKGLSDEENILIEVDAYLKIGKGQRVWPSQEMVLNIPKGENLAICFRWMAMPPCIVKKLVMLYVQLMIGKQVQIHLLLLKPLAQ